MPQLDPVWFASQLFWLFASIVVLFFILSRIVLPPLMAVLEARNLTRETDLALAQRLKTDADNARQEYEMALADARLRAQSIFVDAELKNKDAAEAATRELDRVLTTRIAEAEQRIERSKHDLFKAIQPSLSSIVRMTVEKISGTTADDKQIETVLQTHTRS